MHEGGPDRDTCGALLGAARTQEGCQGGKPLSRQPRGHMQSTGSDCATHNPAAISQPCTHLVGLQASTAWNKHCTPPSQLSRCQHSCSVLCCLVLSLGAVSYPVQLSMHLCCCMHPTPAGAGSRSCPWRCQTCPEPACSSCCHSWHLAAATGRALQEPYTVPAWMHSEKPCLHCSPVRGREAPHMHCT